MRFLLSGTGRLTKSDAEIVRSLNSDGVVVVPFDNLVTDVSFCDLKTAATDLVASRAPDISKLKDAAKIDPSIGRKTFNLEMLGSELTFDPTNIFARFALSRSFVNIANSYFRMQTRLRYYNVWYTSASETTARESQLWHFDREDRYILKVFVYLSDVDIGSGPFTYAPGTHKKGRFSSIAPAFFDENGVRRTTDEQMSNVYPPERWRVCTGMKGTVVFADTRGFHKGGEARTSDRLMFTCMYTSPASESRKLIRYPEKFETGEIERFQRSALGLY